MGKVLPAIWPANANHNPGKSRSSKVPFNPNSEVEMGGTGYQPGGREGAWRCNGRAKLFGSWLSFRAAGSRAEEKLLSKVLRVVRRPGALADVGVERIPISAAKFFQRLGRLGRSILARGQHDAPMRGRKLTGASLGACWQ